MRVQSPTLRGSPCFATFRFAPCDVGFIGLVVLGDLCEQSIQVRALQNRPNDDAAIRAIFKPHSLPNLQTQLLDQGRWNAQRSGFAPGR